MQLCVISAIPSNWKNFIKQNNDFKMFMRTDHHFTRNTGLLTVQKVTSKELYWIANLTKKF